MEQELLQIIGAFAGGLVVGVVIMLIFNKLSSGSASPTSIKQEFDDYQNEVESHFEETSKKFKDMTAQYQDLYKHLSVGATSLCRPDSVAAGLADQSSPMDSTPKLEEKTQDKSEQAAQATTTAKASPEKKGEKKQVVSEQGRLEKAQAEKARLEAKLAQAKEAKLAQAKDASPKPANDDGDKPKAVTKS